MARKKRMSRKEMQNKIEWLQDAFREQSSQLDKLEGNTAMFVAGSKVQTVWGDIAGEPVPINEVVEKILIHLGLEISKQDSKVLKKIDGRKKK